MNFMPGVKVIEVIASSDKGICCRYSKCSSGSNKGIPY